MEVDVLVVMAKEVGAECKDEADKEIGQGQESSTEIVLKCNGKFPLKNVEILHTLSQYKLCDCQQVEISPKKDDKIATGER